MLNNLRNSLKELKHYIILWLSQSLSLLGSSMTNFALIIWSYKQTGSALTTGLLAICSYTPYILFSIFAGALSDRWNKKVIMLVSDCFAAICTTVVLLLLSINKLEIWHIYIINALNGFMNTIQKPAFDVAVTLLSPKKYYQRISGMRSFSDSLITMLTPVITSVLLSFSGIRTVIIVDLATFLTAFFALLIFVRIPRNKPDVNCEDDKNITDRIKTSSRETFGKTVKCGFSYLKKNRGILDLIIFLAFINFVASISYAALPAMILSRLNGGEIALGMVNTVMGLATIIGSLLATFLPEPKSRVRVILNSLLISMSTENFLMAFGSSTPVWCIGAVLGWIFIPLMSTNMTVLFRLKIPVEMQGRVYSVRNSLQFFTIPLGYFFGGFLIDKVFEPFMGSNTSPHFLTVLFGTGKGSGSAFLFFIIGILGMLICLPFRVDRNIWDLEK